MDNVGGTTSVITAARAFAAAARAGFRPRRTVVFATWDAEEWGVMGSIEWVESLAERLRATAVAYVNQDVPVSGTRFGAAAAPELSDLVRAASVAVPDPETGRPVGALWLEAARQQARDADAPPAEAPVRTMGGGSDHMGFYLHLGIPSAGFGFGGAGGGVYHSMYDTAEWMQRFGDPGYRYHAAAARIAAVLLARLANADVLPLDHVALARRAEEELARLAPEVDQALHVAGVPLAAAPGVADQPAPAGSAAADRLHAALTAAMRAAAGLEDAAAAFAAERDRRLEWGRPDPETARRVNAALRAIGPETAAEEGPAGEEWSRNVLVATDPDNGYAALALPGVRLALRRGDLEEAARGLGVLTRALDRASARVSEASEALGS
jgi:N-acetylated-alpha-linked acidic dipeptidase